MGKMFQQNVLWEFRCLLQGEGRDVREALQNALASKVADILDPRNKALLEAIERHEVTRVDGEPTPTWEDGIRC